MAKSPEERNHQEWLGYVQPVGLVVSTPALLAAQCHINKNIGAEHQRFLGILPREKDELIPEIQSIRTFVTEVLGWRDSDLRNIPIDTLPEEFAGLEVVLPEYNETLRPTCIVPVFKPAEDEKPWMILVKESTPGHSLDEFEETDSRRWQASPHAKFERLLRETEIPIGLLSNGKVIRLVYAPRGETSGYMTFSVEQMATVAGRPIFAAMYMLLCEERLFSLEKKQLLPAILADSRKYQNTVSTKLAEQVMAALFELLRGFQSANDQRKGDLLRQVLADDPQHVYHGLLTVLMRMVFVLYAEDRGLLSTDSVYTNFYSVSGLFERLRSDAGRFPDTMNQRYGAWAQLLTLFRIVYEGGHHSEFQVPPRKGYLFDPDRYPFLEGRYDDGDIRVLSEPEIDSLIQMPRVSDGVVYRVLDNLLVLGGERLSYRTLDVEQIGSVYEAVMGFELEVASGRSIAIKPVKSHGAPSTINLETLLDAKPADRAKRLKEWTDQKITGAALKELKEAESIDGLLAALSKKIAKHVTPNVVPKGAMVFQPSDERRRSGSHYTPRSLTEPIVRTTLEPILKALADPEADLPTVYEPSREDKRRYTQGELAVRIRLSEKAVEVAKLARKVGTPHPAQLLDLKICDPAMGSGAFLVEACRQLGDELIKAWYAHNAVPTDIPPDEDEVLYARRLIAQRCLYGVDKNPMAVDLAKLSLWLVTLAKDHPFTFLDHCLRHGDSLVGLTRHQIASFHWDTSHRDKLQRTGLKDIEGAIIESRIARATEERRRILNAREDVPYRDQAQRLALADEALEVVRIIGDACVRAFFAGNKKKDRYAGCDELFVQLSRWFASGMSPKHRGPIAEAAFELRHGEHPIPAFHWEIEFPEVFSRENGGFDAFVGNPPFAGKNTISRANHASFPDWLKQLHDDAHGNSDLVAHFFRRAFTMLSLTGAFGLIATNTIGQGDTRHTGLRWICTHGGVIYNALRRLKWPGAAAVVVSVVHVAKGLTTHGKYLDGRPVDFVSAYLFHTGGHDNPKVMGVNVAVAFQGPIPLGMGLTFDDENSAGVATPISEMHRLIEKDPRNKECIFPYIGGDEMLNDPRHEHRRFIINFGLRSEEEARSWPDLIAIVEEKVKGHRGSHSTAPWWQFERPRPELQDAIENLKSVLMHPFTSNHLCFARLDSNTIISGPHVVFALDSYSSFAVLQSRVHETWFRFFGSSFKDDMRYVISDVFETFPFPSNKGPASSGDGCNESGREMYDHRARLMVQNDEGLTKTYNRFHDPYEQSSEILHLHELHEAMDRAVLEAYGWDDLAQTARCKFLLDYEEEDDENESGRKSKKKKPWRLRWPDDFRDEVLARLLKLNEQRHQEELLAGKAAAEQNMQPQKKTTRRQKSADSNHPSLPGMS